jgi:hypothetical protein
MVKIDENMRKEIELAIKQFYGEQKPEWVGASREVRNRNINIEYNRLTRSKGLTGERALKILAALTDRTTDCIKKVIYN